MKGWKSLTRGVIILATHLRLRGNEDPEDSGSTAILPDQNECNDEVETSRTPYDVLAKVPEGSLLPSGPNSAPPTRMQHDEREWNPGLVALLTRMQHDASKGNPGPVLQDQMALAVLSHPFLPFGCLSPQYA